MLSNWAQIGHIARASTPSGITQLRVDNLACVIAYYGSIDYYSYSYRLNVNRL